MGNYISPSVISPSSYTVTAWTLQDMITQAMRMAHALKMPGQGASPSELQEGLDVCNHMVDGWKLENLLIPFFIRTVVLLQTNQKTYGVGPGQDWDIERPEKIHYASFLINPSTSTECEIPMEVVLTYQEFAAIVAKNVTASIPLAIYYQNTLPYGTAQLWPVPSATTTQVALYTQWALQEFNTVDDNLVTPKGFREMIMYNLAVRVRQRASETRVLAVPMDPTVYQMALETKQRVKNQFIKPIYVGSDPAAIGRRQGRWYGGMAQAWTPYS